MALSPDGSLLAIGNRNGSIQLVNTSSLRVTGSIESISPEGGGPETLTFSPDGRSLAAASQHGPIYLWKLRELATPAQSEIVWEAGLPLRLPVHRAPVKYLAFDSLGERLAGAGSEPLVEVWDLKVIQSELARLGLDD